MPTIDAEAFRDSFVVHYGGDLHQVDAYTFANSLLAICAALEEINNVVNPAFEIDIKVDAIGPGSFRPRIRLKPKTVKAVFTWGAEKLVAPLLIALVVAKVSKHEPSIEIRDSVVVVVGDHSTVTLPREAFAPLQTLRKSPALNTQLSRTFEVLDADSAITNFGIARELDAPTLDIEVPRADFPVLATVPIVPSAVEGRKVVTSPASVVVIRAIFEKSARKWQFAWNGIRISAPITDESFFEKLRSREIRLAWGDTLEVDLRIVQVLDPETAVYLNESYEIVAVRSHLPAPTQGRLLTE